MSDLISRQAAIDAWKEDFKGFVNSLDVPRDDYKGIMEYIDELPYADRPQGEWIYGEHNVAMCDGYRCNRCDFFVPWDYEHKFIDFINDYHFCPNCGARMKGADDGTDKDESNQ